MHEEAAAVPRLTTRRESSAIRRIPWWGYLLFVMLAALVLSRLVQQRIQSVKGAQPPARPVTVAKVITKDVPLYLDEIGTCAAYETVQVQSQVSGQIIARNFQDGAEVKKGDLLFSIDPRPFQAALEQAQGQLGQAQSQLLLDQTTLKRQQELRARSVNSQQDLDVAQWTVNSDLAKVKTAEAAVAAAQVNLDYCSVRSPIDGRAGLRLVDAGNIVSSGNPGSGGAVLLTIQGLDPIYTDFTVAEPDLPLVRRYLGNPNVKVMTRSEDDNIPPRAGDLYFIDNAVQPGAGTVKARAVTPNPDRALWPSQFVRVRLILDILKDAKLVPGGAVQIGQNGPYVFVVKPDSTLELRQVKPGQPQGDLTVVNEGVQAGETVVVSGQLQLAPGTKVVPKEMETPGGSSSAPGAKAFN
jgi:multidrug efflux system membrane fusion protein